MAKKSRRTRTTPRLSTTQLVGASGEGVSQADRAAARRSLGEAPRVSMIREDYTHVTGDLRRILMLAGGLIVIMIVLYFVLPLVMR